MSRAEVRAAVADWLDPSPTGSWAATATPPPDALDKVWTSFPKRIDYREYARIPGLDTRAQAVVFIRNQDETREAIGGATSGKKKQTYAVSVQVFVESYLPEAQDVMDAVDEITDAMVNRLRSDHTLGSAAIWRAAEPSIRLEFGEPFTNEGSATEQWLSVSFTAEQWLTA